MKCHWNLLPVGENSTNRKRCKYAQRHTIQIGDSFELTAREGPQTSNIKHQLIINQTGMSWRLKLGEDCWISPWKICPDLKPQTSRNRGCLVSWPLVSLLSFWELSHFSAQALCGIYLSHERQRPPTPCCHSHFHRLLFQAQRFSPAQRALQFCHLHKLNTCLHCW